MAHRRARLGRVRFASTSYSATVGAPTCSTPQPPTFAADSIPGAAIVTFFNQSVGAGSQSAVPMVTSYGDYNMQSCTLENWWQSGTSTRVPARSHASKERRREARTVSVWGG